MRPQVLGAQLICIGHYSLGSGSKFQVEMNKRIEIGSSSIISNNSHHKSTFVLPTCLPRYVPTLHIPTSFTEAKGQGCGSAWDWRRARQTVRSAAHRVLMNCASYVDPIYPPCPTKLFDFTNLPKTPFWQWLEQTSSK